jgi:hypothetical protein
MSPERYSSPDFAVLHPGYTPRAGSTFKHSVSNPLAREELQAEAPGGCVEAFVEAGKVQGFPGLLMEKVRGREVNAVVAPQSVSGGHLRRIVNDGPVDLETRVSAQSLSNWARHRS